MSFDIWNTDFQLMHYVNASLGYWYAKMKEGKSHEPYKNLLNYGLDRIKEGIENKQIEERKIKMNDIVELREMTDEFNWNNREDMRFLYLMCCKLSGYKDNELFYDKNDKFILSTMF